MGLSSLTLGINLQGKLTPFPPPIRSTMLD
jgi:hypothetical protein